jgi:hypothetical protein
MDFDLETNLIDLPYNVFCQLARQLDKEVLWTTLFGVYSESVDSVYKLRFRI